MQKMSLSVGLSGRDESAIARALYAALYAPKGLPVRLLVDNRPKKPAASWLEQGLAKAKAQLAAGWDQLYATSLTVTPGLIVKASDPAFPRAVQPALDLLAALPFELASFDSIHEAWFQGDGYTPYSFGDLHHPHGWACAFRGDGHRRLVSRRWLDYGPWRVLRGPGDLSLVQFHDLEADAATALEQARPGHARMGISETGGFIQGDYVYSQEISGLYIPEERQLRIIIHGREVSQREMRDACAARLYQALGPDKPLASVAYVFMEEAPARAHLHELWLRELECRAIIAGEEVRLDADYTPAPARPAWVQQLEGR